MEQYYVHLIYGYFIINILTAWLTAVVTGMSWNYSHRAEIIVCAIVGMTLGVFVWAYVLFALGVDRLWNWANNRYQINFWWDYKFTNYFDNMKADRLMAINNMTLTQYNTNSYEHRMCQKCLKLINERNSFIYFPDDYAKTIEF